jgi:arginase family enzyme
MGQEIKIFGAALDPLHSPERLSLKHAYINFLREKAGVERNSDPYDSMLGYLAEELPSLNRDTWVGKVHIDSWLTPKPKLTDVHLLTTESFTNFLRQDGCWDYALRVRDYVEEEIFPSKPVMIGVDHSLTGGVVMALSKRYQDLNIVVFDAHFDVLKYQPLNTNSYSLNSKNCLNNSPLDEGSEIKFYECGNFILYLLEQNVIKPESLWVLGVQDEILKSLQLRSHQSEAERAQTKEYAKLIERGVHLISKTALMSKDLHLNLNGPTYVSIDMDVGSLSSVYSARFMNCIGLTYDEFAKSMRKLFNTLQESNIPCVGLDIMEIDIHLLEANELSPYRDYSREMVKEIIQVILGQDEIRKFYNYG